MEMDEIRCVRLVAARLHGTKLDDKTLTWGATGRHAWGQNVLTGAAAERRTEVMASEMEIIHPQAFLQPERAINVTPENKANTASVFVELHNGLLRVPARAGFSLLNHDVPPMLVEDAVFHKFSEMSNIGPWLDRDDKLQWDHKMNAGYRVACSVRNGRVGGAVGGAANKDALIEKEGYMINERGQVCITGFHKLGNLSRDALIEKEGYMINERGQVCITGFHKLGNLTRDARIEREGYMINKRGKKCITEAHDCGNLGGEASAKKAAAKALDELHTHICISALCGRGVSVRWENGYAVFQHHCYDPQLSGLEGQQPRQKKGLKIQLCKKCHRTLHSCAVPISKKPNIDFLNQRIVQSCLNHFLLSPHPLPSIKLLPRCGYFLPVGHLRNTHSELELCRNTP